MERRMKYYFYGLDLDTKPGHALFMIERRDDEKMLLFSAEEVLANEEMLLKLPVTCERQAKDEIARQKRRRQWKAKNKAMREKQAKEEEARKKAQEAKLKQAASKDKKNYRPKQDKTKQSTADKKP